MGKKKKRPTRNKVMPLANNHSQKTSKKTQVTILDAPPMIRMERGEIEVLKKGYRHRYENQLDKLYELTKSKKGGLRRIHVEAGKRLNRDFESAGIDTMAHIELEKFMGGDFGGPSGGLRAGEKQQHHRELFREAMAAVGHTSARILYSVCCANFTVTEYSQQCGYDKRGVATFRLREALEDLAIHYGMIKPKWGQ